MKYRTIAISICSLAILIAVGIVWWNMPVYIINITPDNVSKIAIFNGGTGQEIIITETSDIEHIVNNLNSISFKKDKISMVYMGYRFRTTIYDQNGAIHRQFIINSENTVRKDPFFYNNPSGSIDIDYISALFGALVSVNGEYTKDEPEYINADNYKKVVPNDEVASEQNQYAQIMAKLNPSIAEMEVLFYSEIDADGDGNIEIISAFGHGELIESCFVLREQDSEIQLVKQDFLPEYGYAHCDMQLARFKGSDLYYIVVGVTNTANMNGLSIYKITENDVLYVDGAQSAVGVCDAYLSDKKEDGTYGGFTAKFSSYDVLYYPTVVTYHFQYRDFNRKDSYVDVGEYSKTPTDVIIHYLSLYCLHQRYFSNDIVERNQEIYDGWWNLSYVDEPGWTNALYHYILGIDSDSSVITADEVITGRKAKVTVHYSDETKNIIILD